MRKHQPLLGAETTFHIEMKHIQREINDWGSRWSLVCAEGKLRRSACREVLGRLGCTAAADRLMCGHRMSLGIWVSRCSVTLCGSYDVFISARTCCTWKSSYDSLLLLLLSRRSDGLAEAHAPVDVLLFLFCWLQDLEGTK
jgi:hypothetical protein